VRKTRLEDKIDALFDSLIMPQAAQHQEGQAPQIIILQNPTINCNTINIQTGSFCNTLRDCLDRIISSDKEPK